MSFLERMFDQMDHWRHFPNYQLERRSDILFSLYLREMLEHRFDLTIREELIPEFPVRIGTIYPQISSDKSFKIDYLALSKDSKTAVLVELKTNRRSRRAKQDRYLAAAQEAGLNRLLEGVLEIFRATNAKRKYFYLLRDLETLGVVEIPAKMYELFSRDRLEGVNEVSHGISITGHGTKCQIAYLQPSGDEPETISFEELAQVVMNHKDPLSQRFAESLIRWEANEPGTIESETTRTEQE